MAEIPAINPSEFVSQQLKRVDSLIDAASSLARDVKPIPKDKRHELGERLTAIGRDLFTLCIWSRKLKEPSFDSDAAWLEIQKDLNERRRSGKCLCHFYGYIGHNYFYPIVNDSAPLHLGREEESYKEKAPIWFWKNKFYHVFPYDRRHFGEYISHEETHYYASWHLGYVACTLYESENDRWKFVEHDPAEALGAFCHYLREYRASVECYAPLPTDSQRPEAAPTHTQENQDAPRNPSKPKGVQAKGDKAPKKPRWEIPNLPERLRKFATVMISFDCKAGTDDLLKPLGFDPSRIFHDYKSGPLKKWVSTHVEKERTGVYVFLPNGKKLKTATKSSQKRSVKPSK